MARKNIDFELVVQTAIGLADKDGFEAVTLASVANQLGIRNPSMYNHVAGLSGLREAMTLWGIRQLTDQMRRAAVGKAGEAAIIAISDALRGFALAHPGIYATTQRAPTADQTELAAASAEALDILLAVLQPYNLNDEEKLHAVRALRSVLHGFVDLEASGGFGMALDREESFRQLVQFFLVGLRPRLAKS
jgi:AcrR family transcriptional regulator